MKVFYWFILPRIERPASVSLYCWVGLAHWRCASPYSDRNNPIYISDLLMILLNEAKNEIDATEFNATRDLKEILESISSVIKKHLINNTP